MKAAVLKDGAFISDVKRMLRTGGQALWWLGQSGFLVVRGGRALILDPYLSDSLTRKYAQTNKPHVRMTERVVAPEALGALGVIDVITSSHNHTDHFDPETLLPLLAANPQAKLVLPAANQAIAVERLDSTAATRLVGLDDGVTAEVAGITLTAVASAHPTVERDEAGHCRFLGYCVRWGPLSLYHSGDTLWHDDLLPALRKFAPEFMLLPINGDRPERRVAGNLNGRQAAQLAHAVGAHWAIPCHFDLFEFNTEPPDEFAVECGRLGQPYRVLANGECFEL
jgi:L-ascorbate metabolism protein UlaG (beta-lactamase superfamily)